MNRSVHPLAVAMIIGMLIGWFGSGATGAPMGQPTPSEPQSGQTKMEALIRTVGELSKKVELLEEQHQTLKKDFRVHTHEFVNIGFGRTPHFSSDLYYVWTNPGGPRLTGPR